MLTADNDYHKVQTLVGRVVVIGSI